LVCGVEHFSQRVGDQAALVTAAVGEHVRDGNEGPGLITPPQAAVARRRLTSPHRWRVETSSNNIEETTAMPAHGNNREPQPRQSGSTLSHPDRVAMLRQRAEIRHLPEIDSGQLVPDCERMN
jgi:hypothetical protein